MAARAVEAGRGGVRLGHREAGTGRAGTRKRSRSRRVPRAGKAVRKELQPRGSYSRTRASCYFVTFPSTKHLQETPFVYAGTDTAMDECINNFKNRSLDPFHLPHPTPQTPPHAGREITTDSNHSARWFKLGGFNKSDKQR